MNMNFDFDSNVSILLNNLHLDLHNNYYLTDISYSDNSTLSILFRKRQEMWINSSDPDFMNLYFYGVDYLELNSIFFQNFPKSVEEIGYKESNDFDLDWLIPQKMSEIQNHLIIRFQEDDYLRIHCTNIYASI